MPSAYTRPSATNHLHPPYQDVCNTIAAPNDHPIAADRSRNTAVRNTWYTTGRPSEPTNTTRSPGRNDGTHPNVDPCDDR